MWGRSPPHFIKIEKGSYVKKRGKNGREKRRGGGREGRQEGEGGLEVTVEEEGINGRGEGREVERRRRKGGKEKRRVLTHIISSEQEVELSQSHVHGQTTDKQCPNLQQNTVACANNTWLDFTAC